MLRALDRAVAQLAALLLLSGLLLVGASLLGLTPGPVLFAPLLAITVALYLAREAIPRIDRYPGWALADLGEDLWLSTLVAASVAVVAPGLSPGELQTVGGLVGLVALLIYFLRPVFRLVARLYWRVTGQPS